MAVPTFTASVCSIETPTNDSAFQIPLPSAPAIHSFLRLPLFMFFNLRFKKTLKSVLFPAR